MDSQLFDRLTAWLPQGPTAIAADVRTLMDAYHDLETQMALLREQSLAEVEAHKAAVNEQAVGEIRDATVAHQEATTRIEQLLNEIANLRSWVRSLEDRLELRDGMRAQ